MLCNRVSEICMALGLRLGHRLRTWVAGIHRVWSQSVRGPQLGGDPRRTRLGELQEFTDVVALAQVDLVAHQQSLEGLFGGLLGMKAGGIPRVEGAAEDQPRR